MMEKRRESGMKAVEKRGWSRYWNIFEDYPDNLHRRLRIPVVNKDQLPP